MIFYTQASKVKKVSLFQISQKIREKTNISGNVTIRDKINIADNSFVGMGAVVTKNVKK